MTGKSRERLPFQRADVVAVSRCGAFLEWVLELEAEPSHYTRVCVGLTEVPRYRNNRFPLVNSLFMRKQIRVVPRPLVPCDEGFFCILFAVIM
jgi:hypothetical protein